MASISACLDLLYGLPAAEYPTAIARAAADGFDRVEFLWWREADLGAVGRAASEHGVDIAAVCAYPFLDIPDPTQTSAFLQVVRESSVAAVALDAPFVVLQGGEADPARDRDEQRRDMLAALAQAASIAEEHGVTLLLEPLNRHDHPGQFLDTTAEGVRIVEELDSPRVRLLYDRYHAIRTDEAIGEAVDGHLGAVAHVHLASAARTEPSPADRDWQAEIEHLVHGGYTGGFGLEFATTGEPAESTAYITQVVRAAAAEHDGGVAR